MYRCQTPLLKLYRKPFFREVKWSACRFTWKNLSMHHGLNGFGFHKSAAKGYLFRKRNWFFDKCLLLDYRNSSLREYRKMALCGNGSEVRNADHEITSWYRKCHCWSVWCMWRKFQASFHRFCTYPCSYLQMSSWKFRKCTQWNNCVKHMPLIQTGSAFESEGSWDDRRM